MADFLKSSAASILALGVSVLAALMTLAVLPARSGFDQYLPLIAAAIALLPAACALRVPGSFLLGDRKSSSATSSRATREIPSDGTTSVPAAGSLALLGMTSGERDPEPLTENPERRSIHAIGLAIPLLIASEALIDDERMRLLSIGVVVAVAFASAVTVTTRRGLMSLPAAGATSLLALVLLRWIPLESVHLLGEVAIATGVLLLIFALRRGDEIAVLPMMLATAVGFLTPSVPGSVSLFPLLCAGLVMAVEWSSWIVAIPTLVVALIAGKWLFVIVALPLAVFAAIRLFSGDRTSVGVAMAVPLPIRLAGSIAAARALLFAPGALAASGGAVAAASAGLIIFSLAARPTLAPMVVAAALLLTVPRTAQTRLAAVTAAMSVLVLALMAWSGLSARVFPLPLPLPLVASISAIAVCGLLSSLLAGAGAAALIASAGILMAPAAVHTQGLGISLTPGQRYEVRLPPDVRSLSLIASGAAVSQLKPGTTLGRIELIDRDGHLLQRRSISIGEVSDWGFLRAEHFFSSRNSLPADPAGTLQGFGAAAFIGGQGRIRLGATRPIVSLMVTSDGALPRGARLELSAIELPR